MKAVLSFFPVDLHLSQITISFQNHEVARVIKRNETGKTGKSHTVGRVKTEHTVLSCPDSAKTCTLVRISQT